MPAGSELRHYNILNLFGDMRACPNITLIDYGQGYIYGFGQTDTIQTNDASIRVNMYLEVGADYEFVGNYNAPSHGLYCRNATTVIRAKSDTFFLQRMNPGQLFMDSTQAFFYSCLLYTSPSPRD